jgi:putative ABC transport system permease protein
MTRSLLEDVVRLSVRMVLRNRRRHKFVMIALAAGVSGFIILLNVSDAVDQRIGAHLIILGGATIIDVERSDFDSPHPGEFHLSDVDRLRRIPHVTEVAAVVSVENSEAAIGSTRLMVRLAGVDASFWRTIMASCRYGRLIEDADVAEGATYGVLGERVAADLFGDTNPLGKTVQLDNANITVIGVLGGIQGADTLRSIFVPLTTARRRFHDMYAIKQLRIRVDHWKEVEPVAENVRNVLAAVHSGHEAGLRVTYYPERIRRVQDTIALVKALILLVCSAVVGLGGFGAAYLMLASVDERTREIGLKKALGGSDIFVMVEFMLEALILCVTGGAIGVSVAVAVCVALKTFMDFDIDSGLLVVSSCGGLAATLIIGLLSGAYPAAKASQMDPAAAMRFE